MRLAATLLVLLLLSANAAIAEEPEFIPPVGDFIPSEAQIDVLTGRLPQADDDAVKPKKIIQVALDVIKVFEGWRAKPYDDPVNYCTIGFGHLIKKAKCAASDTTPFTTKPYSVPMTFEQGTMLLAADTKSPRLLIGRTVTVELTPEQFGALTSLVFNIGGTNFKNSALLRKLNEGDLDAVRREFRKWVHGKGQKLPGLVKRRNCEVVLFNGGTLSRLKNGMIDTDACGVGVGGASDLDEIFDVETGEAFKT